MISSMFLSFLSFVALILLFLSLSKLSPHFNKPFTEWPKFWTITNLFCVMIFMSISLANCIVPLIMGIDYSPVAYLHGILFVLWTISFISKFEIFKYYFLSFKNEPKEN